MVVPVNQVLVLTINIRLLQVGAPSDFLDEVITILQTMWEPNQRTFVVSEAEILTGKLNTSVLDRRS